MENYLPLPKVLTVNWAFVLNAPNLERLGLEEMGKKAKELGYGYMCFNQCIYSVSREGSIKLILVPSPETESFILYQ